MSITQRPHPLAEHHLLADFHCGEASLDTWLTQRARKNATLGASQTYVVCDKETVVGYYCLAAGSVTRDTAPKTLQRNMPDPIPVIILGRLAVDERYHGKALGGALLRDAVFRSLQAASEFGIAAILVHAISESARRFYLKYGFQPSEFDPMLLCMKLSNVNSLLNNI